MPKLGMTMREGRVVSWARGLGERVEKGAPVVVIESEKSEVEIEATASGVLRHVYVGPDETVPCGTLLGAIADAMDAPFDAQAFHREHDRPELPAPASAGTGTGARPLAAPRRDAVPTTPAARA